jgi:predicted signal transduction protein with EAL and GGDEF domain
VRALKIDEALAEQCDLATLIDARLRPAPGKSEDPLAAWFKNGLAFADITFSMLAGGTVRHLLLSAKPILDSHGLVQGWRGVATDVTAQKLAEAKVLQLAHFDSLTSLPNRSYFYEQFDIALKGLKRDRYWLACVDLDGFKQVNDTYGHEAGDKLLCQALRFLRDWVVTNSELSIRHRQLRAMTLPNGCSTSFQDQ